MAERRGKKRRGGERYAVYNSGLKVKRKLIPLFHKYPLKVTRLNSVRFGGFSPRGTRVKKVLSLDTDKSQEQSVLENLYLPFVKLQKSNRVYLFTLQTKY